MNDGKEFTNFAKHANGELKQVKIQKTRTLVSDGMTASVKAFNGGCQKNAVLLSQLRSMLFSTISRTSQNIGR